MNLSSSIGCMLAALVCTLPAAAGAGGDFDGGRVPGRATGNVLLASAEEQQMAGVKAGDLIGTEWRLRSMTFDGAPTELAPDTPVSIRFDDKGRVSGRAPVNRFTGQYKLGGDGTISWGDTAMATTRMAGPPAEMEREDLFLQVLGQVTRYRLSGSELVLEATDSDTSLTFTK